MLGLWDRKVFPESFFFLCLEVTSLANISQPTTPGRLQPFSSRSPSPAANITHPSVPSFHSASNQLPATQGPNGPPQGTNADCTVYPLDQSTWQRLGWDDYLRNYPNGTTLTPEAYAASKGAMNFRCAIGTNCNIGQLCSPVKAPDWYILYATQNANTYLNTLYEVTGEALSFTQRTIASVWNDLFPSVVDHTDLMTAFVAGTVGAGVLAAGLLYLLFIPDVSLLFTAPLFAVMEVVSMPFTYMMLGALLATLVGQLAFSHSDLRGPTQTEEFELWTQFNYRLTQWQEETQRVVANTTAMVFHTAISSGSNYSLSNFLANGTFLNPMNRKNTFELQVDLKNITNSIAISKLLQSMNAFVTISNDPNPSKKWRSKDRLSYLSPNGTLMNIIRVVPGDDEAINDFKNGHVLFEKYGVSTEYIATNSFECQQRFGIQKANTSHIANLNAKVPTFALDPSVCMFDLPVCDLRDSEAQTLKRKHKRTVNICRKVFGLPI